MSQTTMTWVKSSFCANGTCVEVAQDAEFVAIRDGKRREQQMLRVSRDEWRGFLAGVRAGDYPS